jgi:uncharacterized protein
MKRDLIYHEGSRHLQDRFVSRRIADHIKAHVTFTEADRAFIEQAAFFFLATADKRGAPECSYKGGLPGFVRITGPSEIAFPDYDGNGMFKSLGNVLVNAQVGLLFIDFEHQRRLRLNGVARLSDDDPLGAEFPGAQLVVRVKAVEIFANCPRHVHRMVLQEHSRYAPQPDYTPPEPEWKLKKDVAEVLPRTEQHR